MASANKRSHHKITKAEDVPSLFAVQKLEHLTSDVLRKMLKNYGQPVWGLKDEMIKRLKTHLKETGSLQDVGGVSSSESREI